MSESYVDFSTGGLVRIVRRHLVLVLVCVVAGLAVAGVRLYLTGFSYTSTSQVLVGQPLTLQALTTQTAVSVDQARLVDATKRMIESDGFARAVERRKGIGKDGDFEVAVAAATSTNVIGINVTAGDADRAKALADAYAAEYLASTRAANEAKVARAVRALQSDLDATAQQFASAPEGSAQRSALVQQQLALQNRLSQVRLAGVVDPSGGAQLIQKAEAGDLSVFSAAAPVVLGGLFGLLVGLGLAGFRELGARRTDEDEVTTEHPTPRVTGTPVTE